MTDTTPVRPRIHIVGANPSMDRTQFVDRLEVGEVNRAAHVEPMAGGKGLIVARAMARLGTPTAVYGFVGGSTGAYIRAECARLGIVDRHTGIAGDTRINAIIVEQRTGASTVINEPGPHVGEEHVEALLAEISSSTCKGDIVALSGSLPIGVDAAFVGRVVGDLARRGVQAIIDTSGAPLEAAVAAGPWAIKCNLDEFRALRPDAPGDAGDDAGRRLLLAQMHELRAGGVDVVVVTLGADGAIACSATEAVWVRPPRIEVVNATGSGDTFLAGFLHAHDAGASLADAVRFAVAASVVNALRPLPDIGEDPQLAQPLAGTVIVFLDPEPGGVV